MNNPDSGLSQEVMIANELGLHARSASKIAAIAGRAKSEVWIMKGEERADASSIVDILTLACEKGTKITVYIENESDLDILDAIIDLIEGGFGE